MTGWFGFLGKRSLGTQLFLYVLVGALSGLGGMSFLFYQILERLAENDIREKLNTEVRLIEKQLAEAERTGINLAIAIGNLKDQGIEDPEVYKNLIFQTYLQRPELSMAVGFGQKPYGILSDRQWYWPYFYLDQQVEDQAGQQLPAPYQTIRFAELFQDDDYPRQDYYTLIANHGQPQWMEPYRWYVLTMTTYLAPIRDRQQNLIGMTGVDVNVTTISQAIDHPVLAGGGYFLILSQQGHLLAYPPDPNKAKDLVTQTELPEIADFYKHISQDPSSFFVLKHNYWSYQKIQGTHWIMVASVPRSLILQPVLAITLSSGISAGIMMAIAVFLFIRKLNQRLQPILEACQNILLIEQADEKTALSLPKFSIQGDEIEVLAQSFHYTTQKLQSTLECTRKFNQSLERFVPKEFLEFLGKSSFTEIKLGDQVQRNLSVLFSDIRNFTSASEAMTPEENFQFVNAYFGCISPAIRENHGFIDKYIGDAVMALFGEKADDAVRAGLDILEKLKDFNQKREIQGQKPIVIGIGINTGELMIGTVGEESRMDNTVISDTVNVSARIEQLTKIYQVPLLISQETLDCLSDASTYAIRRIGQVKIRGKSQTTTIYEVFDGDLPDIKAQKIANQALFEQAVMQYQLCLFQHAEQLFQECLRQNSGDHVSRIYIDFCQEKIYRFRASTLEESFQKIRLNFPAVAETFYKKLFDKFPSLQNLFSQAEIYHQQIKFAQMIELMIENIRNYELVASVLKELGQKHSGYGVIAEYYPMVREVFLEALAVHLAEDWTPEVDQAWDEAYSLVQEIMLSGTSVQV